MNYIFLYIATVPVFFIIDFLWLNFVAKNLYQQHIGHLLASPFNIPVALIFYLIFIVGILIFAVIPAVESQSIGKALLLGALFGFFTYATYDLTNWATLKDWSGMLSLIDMAWGTVLSASVSVISYTIATRFFFT